MVQLRNHPHLTLEEPCRLKRCLTILLISSIRADHLNRHLPLDPRILREVNLTHCPFAEHA